MTASPPPARRIGRRRVTTAPTSGVAPEPRAEEASWDGGADEGPTSGANDERLKRDVPPHW